MSLAPTHRADPGGGMNRKVKALLAARTALGCVGQPDDVGRIRSGMPSRRDGS
jgi:hypothetical protein